MIKRSFLLIFGLVSLFALIGQAGLPDKGWGVGIQLNYPFTGLSVRFFNAEGIGFELNIFPNPTSRDVKSPEGSESYEVRRLELTLSGKLLYPVRQDENVNYYFSGGAAITFAFEEEEPALTEGIKQPMIHSGMEGAILSGMGVIEVEGIWLDRLVGTFEYGLTWDLFDPLNFSFLSGGIGAHYYI